MYNNDIDHAHGILLSYDISHLFLNSVLGAEHVKLIFMLYFPVSLQRKKQRKSSGIIIKSQLKYLDSNKKNIYKIR